MRCFDLTSENETFLTSARALREFCSGYPVKPLKSGQTHYRFCNA